MPHWNSIFEPLQKNGLCRLDDKHFAIALFSFCCGGVLLLVLLKHLSLRKNPLKSINHDIENPETSARLPEPLSLHQIR